VVHSKLFKEADLAWQRDSWLRLHRPMANRELDAVIGDWVECLGTLEYLRIIKSSQNYGTDHLITIRCKSKLPEGYSQGVQADLERIWIREVSVGMECGHTFRKLANGFEMQFIGLNTLNVALSGQIIVEMATPSG
jgi:hypothetical protein